ncbi:MAG: hypothetical protein AAGD96_06610 [Chloroflexota bacterium]
MNLKIARIAAVIVGLATVAWQIFEWVNGRGANQFFLADIVIGLFLAGSAVITNKQSAKLLMLIGFALISGVFAVASLGAISLADYTLGPLTTTIGLSVCLPMIVLLARQINQNTV